MKKIEDKLFIFCIALIIIGGFVKHYIKPSIINSVENRNSYQIPKFDISTFLNKEYQDNMENAYADQIPLSNRMKSVNKEIDLKLKMDYYKNYSKDNYFRLNESISIYQDYLVYEPYKLDVIKPQLNTRIESINNFKERNPNIDVYAYYIERDFDINLKTSKKVKIYEYFASNLDSSIKTSKLEINNFNDYKNMFYQTDHHWNYKGSYKGYTEIMALLGENNPIKYNKEICFNEKISGSKTTILGGMNPMSELVCAYEFLLKKHEIYINNIKASSYNSFKQVSNKELSPNYGNLFGWDEGLFTFDFNNPNKENLLILGDSFDNPINELIASHFNKTYNVDLRHYERRINEKFNIDEFIEKNNITKVLFVGNANYYRQDIFAID